jgi:hypothetical protein
MATAADGQDAECSGIESDGDFVCMESEQPSATGRCKRRRLLTWQRGASVGHRAINQAGHTQLKGPATLDEALDWAGDYVRNILQEEGLATNGVPGVKGGMVW